MWISGVCGEAESSECVLRLYKTMDGGLNV